MTRQQTAKKSFTAPNQVLSGLNGAMPTVYHTAWQTFTDLNDDQKAWYMAQPEWTNFLSWAALDPVKATIQADAPSAAVINAALQTSGQHVAVNPTPLPPTPSPVKP